MRDQVEAAHGERFTRTRDFHAFCGSSSRPRHCIDLRTVAGHFAEAAMHVGASKVVAAAAHARPKE
jgi:hypothetical protein